MRGRRAPRRTEGRGGLARRGQSRHLGTTQGPEGKPDAPRGGERALAGLQLPRYFPEAPSGTVTWTPAGSTPQPLSRCHLPWRGLRAVREAAVSTALLLRELEQDWKGGPSAPGAPADVLPGLSRGAELETRGDTHTHTHPGLSPLPFSEPPLRSCSLMPDLIQHLPWLSPDRPRAGPKVLTSRRTPERGIFGST